LRSKKSIPETAPLRASQSLIGSALGWGMLPDQAQPGFGIDDLGKVVFAVAGFP
jgi:hypothetical protein